MLIKDIIISAAEMLAMERVLGLPELGGGAEDANGTKELSLLLRCTNLVLNELTSEYLKPRKTRKVVAGTDGRVEYAQLLDRVTDIISVRDGSGRKQGFSAKSVYIQTTLKAGAELTVEYVYTLPALGLDDDTGLALNNVSERLAAYGVAAEFCIINGIYDEAAMWDKRYKDALLSALRSGREIKYKGRRWV